MTTSPYTASIGLNAAWWMLSVLPAGDAVDAAARVVLNYFAPRLSYWSSGTIPLAVSPSFVRTVTSDEAHRRALAPVWSGFTIRETARAAVDASVGSVEVLTAALNPATGLTDGDLRELFTKGPLLGRSGVPDVGALVKSDAGSFGRRLSDFLTHSSASPFRAELAVQILGGLQVVMPLVHEATVALYPHGASPYAAEVVDALADSWRRQTNELYRPGPTRALPDTPTSTELLALGGPEDAKRVLHHLRTTPPERLSSHNGGQLHINPWLREALLLEDFTDWGMLLGPGGCKPIAGQLLGEELRARIGEDPGGWVTSVELLLSWESSLAEWLDTAEALK